MQKILKVKSNNRIIRNAKDQECKECEIVKSNNRIIQKSKSSNMQKM